MVTEILTALFVLGLPLWLVAEELLTRMQIREKAESTRPHRGIVAPSEWDGSSASRPGPERVAGEWRPTARRIGSGARSSLAQS